jgi:hypothetical protein
MEVQLTADQEAFRAEILAAVDVAEASLARGEGRVVTEESMLELAEQVKQRGRARLASERPAARIDGRDIRALRAPPLRVGARRRAARATDLR